MKELVDEGVIRRVGGTKLAKWEIV